MILSNFPVIASNINVFSPLEKVFIIRSENYRYRDGFVSFQKICIWREWLEVTDSCGAYFSSYSDHLKNTKKNTMQILVYFNIKSGTLRKIYSCLKPKTKSDKFHQKTTKSTCEICNRNLFFDAEEQLFCCVFTWTQSHVTFLFSRLGCGCFFACLEDGIYFFPSQQWNFLAHTEVHSYLCKE